MQRLPSSFLLILSCLCLFLHLLPRYVVPADDATPVCDPDTKSGVCANLGPVSYPFGDAAPCAASDSFRFNCSSSPPSWDAFSQAFGGDEGTTTYIAGIAQLNNFTYINLTWSRDSSTSLDPCYPLHGDEVDTYIPKSINLTGFANRSLLLSYHNHILLLNCSSLPLSSPPNYININSPTCLGYHDQCALIGTPCAEIAVPTQQLSFPQALQSFSCSHFQFLVTVDDSSAISTWQPGQIQLVYTNGNDKCAACYISGGSCLFPNRTFQGCLCQKNQLSDTDCDHIKGCDSFNCNAGAKIAVGVTATVVGMGIVTMAVVWAFYRKSRYSTKSFTSASSNRLFTQRAYMLSKKFGPVATKEFSFEVLSKATKSFADENMIGDGGFGAVYFGMLRDGRKIAVKRLYHDNFKRMDHFYNEIKILSNLSHPNLVKLYGFCCQDSNDLLLVFEYASNGTVSDQLHDVTKPAMPWKTRLNIARETAEALSYLHNSVNPPIFHRDVKTTNILLDDGLHAKLADFGLSRLVPLEATHVSTAPQGTPGYLDPDYHQCYQLTDKSDVYSFGVVLVELVSAKLAVDMSRDRREINLSNLALMKIGCGQWEDLVDPRLEMRKNPDIELMLKRVIELAFMCLHAEKDSRPTMKYIAEMLAGMCKEFEYGHGHVDNTFSFALDINASSPADEASQLIKSKSTSRSTRSANSPTPSSADWTSSNSSSYVNSF